MLVYQRVSSLRRAVMMNKNLNKLATRSLKVVARLSDQVFLFSKTAHSGSMTYSASQTRCNLVLRVRSPSAYVGNPRKTLPFWDGFAGSICSDFWDGLLNIWFATIHRCYVFFRFPQTVCPSQCWCRLGPRVDWLTVEPETTKKPSGKAGRVKEKLLEGAKFVGNTAAKSEPLDQIRSWVRCGTANGWPKMMRQVHKGISEEIGQEQYALFETWRAGLDTRMSANLLPFARSAPLMGDDHCPSHSGHSQILPLLCSRKFPSFSSKSSTTFPGTSSTANHALPHRASSKRFVRHTIWIHLVSRAMAVVLWEYPLYFQCLWSTCIKGMRKDKTYLISRVFLQITSNYRSY